MLLRWTQAINKIKRGVGFRTLLLTRKQEYLLLWGDKAGSNAVHAEQGIEMLEGQERQYGASGQQQRNECVNIGESSD
jgi:hypothetical protein